MENSANATSVSSLLELRLPYRADARQRVDSISSRCPSRATRAMGRDADPAGASGPDGPTHRGGEGADPSPRLSRRRSRGWRGRPMSLRSPHCRVEAWVTLALAVAIFSCARESSRPPARNLVLVTADSKRLEASSAFDGVARRSIRLASVYAPSPQSSTATASCFRVRNSIL